MGVVIIGNGPAAVSAVEAIRNIDRDCDITIVSKEKEPAYTPCFLYRYVSGKIGKEKLYMREGDFYDKNRITTVFGTTVTNIMPNDKKVRLSDGNEILYDSLLIAAGAKSIVPRLEGIEGEGVFTFRTMSDADGIKSFIALNKKGVRRAVVMGAGFIGLEIAEAFNLMGVKVTVVEREDRVLPRVLDGEIADIVKKHIEDNGVGILTGRSIESIKRDAENRIEGVMLDKGEDVPCDILIVAAGVKPNLEMIKNSFIKINNGVLVDDHMRTNIPNIYAAGDIAEIEIDGIKKVNPIHVNAVKSGYIAGCNIAGIEKRMDSHFEDMNVVNIFGLSILSLGIQSGERMLKRRDSKGIAKVYLDEKGHMQGVQLVGDVMRGGIYLSLIRRGIPVSEKTDITSLNLNYGLILNQAIGNKLLRHMTGR